MNLPEKVVRQIERGAKTQHRVLVAKPTYVERPGPRGTIRTGDSSYYLTQPFKPEVGQSLVVQNAVEHEDEAKRLPQVRVIVTDVATNRLGDITTEQARAEGYSGDRPLTDFAHDWMSRHDPRYPPLAEKLCPNCQGEKFYKDADDETVECDYPGCDEVGTVLAPTRPDTDTTLDWFTRRHGHHLVYVITFELQADVTRFLSRRAGSPPTTSIGEALDPTAPLLGPPSREWKQRAEAYRREALRDRDSARLAGLDRLAADLQAEAQRLALESDTDVSSLVRQTVDRIDRIKNKVAGRSDQHRRAA